MRADRVKLLGNAKLLNTKLPLLEDTRLMSLCLDPSDPAISDFSSMRDDAIKFSTTLTNVKEFALSKSLPLELSNNVRESFFELLERMQEPSMRPCGKILDTMDGCMSSCGTEQQDISVSYNACKNDNLAILASTW